MKNWNIPNLKNFYAIERYWDYSKLGVAFTAPNKKQTIIPIADISGADAQNNLDPHSVFINHTINIYNNLLYDASYGKGSFNNIKEWEAVNVKAYGGVVDYVDKNGILHKLIYPTQFEDNTIQQVNY